MSPTVISSILRQSLSTLPTFVGRCAGRCTSSLLTAAVVIHSFPSLCRVAVPVLGTAPCPLLSWLHGVPGVVCAVEAAVVCCVHPWLDTVLAALCVALQLGSVSGPVACLVAPSRVVPLGSHGSCGFSIACVMPWPHGCGGGPGGGGGCPCTNAPISWLKVHPASLFGCSGWLLYVCWSECCCFLSSSHDTW